MEEEIMSYSWLREYSNDSVPVTQGDLNKLEDYADKLFSKVGVDVEFTRHFLDRVNDTRNQKQINVAELIRIFKQEYKYYGKKIAQLGPDAEAVMKDMRTDVNIPFALRWDSANNELDLIAKTVMRKKDFKTSNPEFAVEEFSWTEAEENNTKEWQKMYGDYAETNIFEELAPESELYVDMDGVLADFFGEWAKLMGVDSWRNIKDIDSALNKIKQQPNFWINLPMTSNALQLLSAIKAYKGKYNILSAPLAGDKNSVPQKKEWIKKNLSSFPPQKIIIDPNKSKYAKQPNGTPNGLIDDYGDNIRKWEQAGGIAIKHNNKNIDRTISKLDLEINEDPFHDISRFINRITSPKSYKYAVELLHKILQRKEQEDGKLKHSLGYYAQSVANTIKGADWRNIVKLYIKQYGDEAVIQDDVIKENGIITDQNTTDDVKPGETQRQALKFGSKIDKKGSPPLLHKSAAKNSDPNTLSNLGIGNK
jgi:5'(3')-deoxyribonucleotidase